MAVILSFPERVADGRRAALAALPSAEIVILPCIRRERLGHPAGLGARLDDEPTQLQA